jgi:predicted permease
MIAGAGFALARWLNASATTLTHIVFYTLLPCFAFRLLISPRPSCSRWRLSAPWSRWRFDSVEPKRVRFFSL